MQNVGAGADKKVLGTVLITSTLPLLIHSKLCTFENNGWKIKLH